ncbi:hypothetical protein NKI56_07160 [Mesorhizobium sp. M0622]|uniref:hypothetical protein n=1 Tax=unclassified Mesorhizobium TaxID=325217 RepID=UPI00333C090E
MHTEARMKRRAEAQAADLPRLGDVADIEHNDTRRTIRQIDKIAGDIRRAVQRDILARAGAEGAAHALRLQSQPVAIGGLLVGGGLRGCKALAAGLVLARHPPASGFARTRAIRNIEDDVDVAPVTRHAGGKVDITSTGIEVAMRAVSAGTVVTELFRIDGVGDIPDQNAFAKRCVGVTAEMSKGLFEGGHHRVAGQIYL